MALTCKGVAFAWTDQQQVAFGMPQCWVFLRRTAGLFWIRMPAFLQWGGVLNQLQEDREVVIVFARRSLRLSQNGIALHGGRCWRRLSCALISGRTYGELSSLCVRITVHFGGCRSFGTVMACWLAGICYWVSFQLHSNTARGPSMLTWMAYPSNVDSVRGRTAQCRLPTHVPTKLLDQPFASSEMGDSMDADYCRNCPEKRGWQPPTWKNSGFTVVHPGVIRP